VSNPVGSWLLAATWAFPLLLLLAGLSAPLRRRLPGLLWLAPVPGLAAALLALDAPALELGAGRLTLLFALDRPGAVLLCAAALLWTAAGAYASTYMRETAHRTRFTGCWLLAAAGCLGAFVAADLVSLYAMLAMLTLGASGLVIHDQTPRAWRAGAIYLLLALLAESLLLVAFVLLAAGIPGDSLAVRDAAAVLESSPQRGLILALLVAGFGAKAGLAPLHFWMPLAHAAAPVPASSVLSGAVIKVGIIGLIRFLPGSTALPDWGLALATAGFVTAFYGVLVGLTQRHPKAVLAYSSVSQMGVVAAVLGLGLAAGDGSAGVAAAFYASHHVLAKGALFLSVGVIAYTAVPRRAVVLVPAALLCLGLGGLPLTGGFLAKYAVKGQFDAGLAAWLAAASAIGTTLLMLHFLGRLARTEASSPAPTAPARLQLPWLVAAMAALLLPWLLYPATGLGQSGAALAPGELWSGLWPVAIGSALALLLRAGLARLPQVPEGDIAQAIDPASRAVRRWGRQFDLLDDFVRQWLVAALSLLLLAIAFGLTFLPALGSGRL
jgi:multicomponent Na+:H+ antiporter subunit A